MPPSAFLIGSVRPILMLACLWGIGLGGNASAAVAATLQVPLLHEAIRLDGRLEESCYQAYPPLTNFLVAREPAQACPPTRAWLFWRPEELVFAFDVTDSQVVAALPSKNEHDVDAQDRVELFLWSGDTNDTYYCIEVAARGAVHDYSARFYRRFDDSWSPAGLQVAVSARAGGYQVEGRLPRAALERIGLPLSGGKGWRVGLFRADISPARHDDPIRITWVDAAIPKPDFHVPGSFGRVVLAENEPLAVQAVNSEASNCCHWVEQVFGNPDGISSAAYLKVLYEDTADTVTRGRSWRGTPYMLGEKQYAHGLAFNSTKHLLVHLGRPAERFVADVGIENNDDTRRGAAMGMGSVTFHVLVGGKEVLATPVRRLRDGALPIAIPLGGAVEFEIRVKDGGDGRGWDQALWAEATVELRDGTRLRLQDLAFEDGPEANPFSFSFNYQGTNSAALLGQWKRQVKEGKPGDGTTQREVTWIDPVTRLEVRAEATVFKDFPAVEWVVHLKNGGTADSPLIESIQALDGALPVPGGGEARLHWSKGALASFDDFAPQEMLMKAGAKLHLQPGGGRSSSEVLPFFNLESGGGGVVTAIGWTGEWAADFVSGPRGQVRMKAGLALTHLVLHPGESIRTPRMLLVFYDGDRWRGQNLLRQFILAHHRPRPGGQTWTAPITCGNWGGTRAEIHLDNIRKIVEHDLPLSYYWIDAEWFGKGGWGDNVGNWETKKDLYPAGFKPLSDALRASGRELMLWFEPERVYKGTAWHRAHRDWLLDTGGDNLLFDLGNPEARKFLIDFISSKVDKFGLGCYRQDFNMEPLPFWRHADAPNRQGIAEIRHIEGLYAFWDELLARHPGLIIDNCASGGRRIDLETIGRATPFWRTDGPRDAIAHQCHTFGLLPWIPLSATSQDRAADDYEFRSSMCSGLCLNWWITGDAPAERIASDFPFPWAKRTLDQYVKLRSFYYGDYYPLSAYSQGRDFWMAYQLHRPDSGGGMVVALRRPDSPYESARFPLHGLEAGATYEATNLDTREKSTLSGKELLERGLEVGLKSRPGSALIVYERK